MSTSVSKQQIAETARFTLGLGKMLVADIPDERFTERPAVTMNHPAWIIGHLAYVADAADAFLGGQSKLPHGWLELFKGGSQLTADRADYPSKDALMSLLEDATARAAARFPEADDAWLAQDLEDPRRRERFGTNGRFLTFVLTAHAAFHFGQLSTWRRAAGFGSAM